MNGKWRAMLIAFTALCMAAFTAVPALAASGQSYTDEQWDENLYCGIGAETTMAHPGDEVRVWWKTLDETITGYRIYPVPHNDGFWPNSTGTGYITVGDDATLFELFIKSADKSVKCKLLIGIWADGSGTLGVSGPGGGNPPPPKVCPPGYTGTYPDCDPPTGECPDGRGEWPNCEEPPTECPEGYTGTPPNCEPEEPEECPPGYTGTYPDCDPPSCEVTNTCPPPPPCEVTNTCPPPPPCEVTNTCPPPPPCEVTNTCPPPPPCEVTNTCPPPPPEECPEGQVGNPPNCNTPGPPDDHCDNGVGTGSDCPPPGDPKDNDDCEEAEPGSPGCEGDKKDPPGPPEGAGPPNGVGPQGSTSEEDDTEEEETEPEGAGTVETIIE